MSMYAKYGVVVSLEDGMMILLASEIVHSVTYQVVDSAVSHVEMEQDKTVLVQRRIICRCFIKNLQKVVEDGGNPPQNDLSFQLVFTQSVGIGIFNFFS